MDITKFGDVDKNIPYNNFPMAHRKITTMQFGKLYPSLVKEIIPGDKISLRSSKLLRMLPLLAPLMTNARVQEDVYFVPNRILWSNWEKFITGTGTDIEFPRVKIDASEMGTNITQSQTIWSYLGIPITGYPTPMTINNYFNALPFAAYNAIYNEYYRNDYLQDEIPSIVTDGDTNDSWIGFANNGPYLKNWTKDYFFGATPTPQHGINVLLPVTTKNDIDVFLRTRAEITAAGHNPDDGNPWVNVADDTLPGGSTAALQTINTTRKTLMGGTSDLFLKLDPQGSLGVKINEQAVTIDALKTAMALQTFLERDLVGGLHYIDNILTHFGVIVPDYRAQVPEFIGSISQNFDITEVLSKSEAIDGEDVMPLGSYAGHGFSASGSQEMSYYATEHGFLMSIISIIPELVYPNTGLKKFWTKYDRTDYAFPTFAELGMQPVYRDELYWTGGEPEVWGYRPIYDDYRFEQSIASGDITGSLDFWANYLKIYEAISLSADTIKIDQRLYDLDRIFSIDTNGPSEQILDYIYIDTHYDLTMMRKLPRFNIPNISGS